MPFGLSEISTTPSPYGTTGYYQRFDSGAIHASPLGCWFTYGVILQRYADNGGSGGHLGFPLNDPYNWNGVLRQDYEGGFLTSDTDPPSINVYPDEIAGWYRQAQQVSWNVNDSASGIAVVEMWWNGDGHSGVGATGSTSMQQGNNTFHVFTRDNAGNSSQINRTYKLDTIAPSIEFTIPAVSPRWFNKADGAQLIAWNISDATSGLAAGYPKLQWDGGAQNSIVAEGNAQISEGKHSAVIIARDAAGNESSKSGGVWQIDTLSPIVNLSLNPSTPNGENGWYTVYPSFSVSATDPNGSNGSGLDEIIYSVDSSSDQSYTAPVQIMENGVHSCKGKASDIAGNSGSSSIDLKIDTTAPIFVSIDSKDESDGLDTLSASWICYDSESGIASYEYSVYRENGEIDDLIAGPITTLQAQAYQTNLGLVRGECYYFLVRAKNNAGLYTSVVASKNILAVENTRNTSPCFNIGGVSVPVEARTSTSYMLLDSLGQFVVDTATSSNFVVESGYWHSDISTTSIDTVAHTKLVDNNQLIQLGSPEKPVVVTAIFGDRFYVEQPDRSSGIAVQFGPMLGMQMISGDRVWIIGTMNILDSERIIQYAAPTYAMRANPLDALFVGNTWLGGSNLNALTPGITNAAGLNNIGLYIKTSGRITQIEPNGQYFYIDDGSGILDATKTGIIPNIGVRIAADGRSYTPGEFITVTGISSCFIDDSGMSRRLIRSVIIEPL